MVTPLESPILVIQNPLFENEIHEIGIIFFARFARNFKLTKLYTVVEATAFSSRLWS